jgi:hypothetical protein
MYHNLLAWGQSLNYPTIVLCRAPRDVLQAGRDAWQRLLASGDNERIERLCERRDHWQAICGRTRGNLVQQ